MLKFSANLSMLFQEVDFLDRFCRAKEAGFQGVEYLFPYQWPAEQLADLLHRYGLTQVLHNLPPGDWAAGERGIACIPGREAEFCQGIELATHYAKILGCSRLNCLVGKTPETVSPELVHSTLVSNLRFAAEALASAGITLLVEPLNGNDIPGFHLVHSADAIELMDEVGHPNLFLQYDVYHMQIMEGNLIATLGKRAGRIGHIQIADVPGRHEPGTGEINFQNIFRALDQGGYAGWIGCEYKPATTTEAGLGWAKPYLV
jgi:hydroxypyruvate isomerase